MTREEAIERLKQNKAAAEFYAGMAQNTNTIENELKDIEAMNMGIEALQADRLTEWIPVSERLPENSRCVLISIAGDIEFGAYDRQNSDWAIWRDTKGNVLMHGCRYQSRTERMGRNEINRCRQITHRQNEIKVLSSAKW